MILMKLDEDEEDEDVDDGKWSQNKGAGMVRSKLLIYKAAAEDHDFDHTELGVHSNKKTVFFGNFS